MPIGILADIVQSESEMSSVYDVAPTKSRRKRKSEADDSDERSKSKKSSSAKASYHFLWSYARMLADGYAFSGRRRILMKASVPFPDIFTPDD